jgi:TusA-related sulfurtransferase
MPGTHHGGSKNMKNLQNGEYLQITTTDCNFVKDISSWCEKNQNTLIKTDRENKYYKTIIKKGL